jgi:hypothetical protein
MPLPGDAWPVEGSEESRELLLDLSEEFYEAACRSDNRNAWELMAIRRRAAFRLIGGRPKIGFEEAWFRNLSFD